LSGCRSDTSRKDEPALGAQQLNLSLELVRQPQVIRIQERNVIARGFEDAEIERYRRAWPVLLAR